MPRYNHQTVITKHHGGDESLYQTACQRTCQEDREHLKNVMRVADARCTGVKETGRVVATWVGDLKADQTKVNTAHAAYAKSMDTFIDWVSSKGGEHVDTYQKRVTDSAKEVAELTTRINTVIM